MSKSTDEEKIQHVMKFLTSFLRRDVAALMSLRGFTGQERQLGFEKVDQAAGRHWAIEDAPIGTTGPEKSLVAAIDSFENIWFDVVDATLGYEYPKVHAKVLKNLKKTSGAMVVLNVKTLLERVEALQGSDDADEQAAFALLEQRGLDLPKRSYAKGLIAEVYSSMPKEGEAPAGPTEKERQALRAAVDDMWAWYTGWAKIARTVVKDKRLRIIMGVSAAARHDEDLGDAPSVTDPAPGTPAAPTPA